MFIHEMFSLSAARSSHKIAIRSGKEELTYEQLEIMSNQIANCLIAQGVTTGELVGICMRRSPEMIASLLGILKAGAAYLPLDPTYPVERLHKMQQLSGVTKVVVEREFTSLLGKSTRPLDIQELSFRDFSHAAPSLANELVELVYVIYTSGSTGTPKGVSLGHKALANLIIWQNAQTVHKETITLQFAPISFDVHFQEIFSTLTLGGELVLISEEDRLDPARLLSLLDERKVNRLFMPYVALNQLAETAKSFDLSLKYLKEVTTAGEQLKVTPAIRWFFQSIPDALLYNHYGPSETHVVTSHTLQDDPSRWPHLPPIGKGISGVQVFILDENLLPVSEGEEGELYLGGVCLAHGYLNSPDLTSERFFVHPQFGRVYKTGDLVKVLENGDIYFMGRSDGQLKVRGHRIEKGEIELKMLEFPEVEQAAVSLLDDREVAALCGYYTGKASAQNLRKYLQEILPDYMVPAYFIPMNELPMTPSGKVDYRNLPRPGRSRPELSVPYRGPKTPLEKNICELWSHYLGLDQIGVDDIFFDLGGNSLLAIKFMVEFNQRHSQKLSITDLFQYPTVSSLCSFLEGKSSQFEQKTKKRNVSIHQERSIAVVGMTGRFPGARNLDEFWQNLIEGRCTLEKFPLSEVNPGVPSEVLNDPNFIPVKGEMPGQESFDCHFFGMTPREAELMDPQQRKFLELAHEAVELSGHNPESFTGPIGVFAGTGNSLYGRLVDQHQGKIKDVGEFNVMLGLEKDYIATRTAYKLNLKGPALSVHTGCSTSLVAIINAVQALRNGDCDMALAGGISISGAPNRGHVFQEGGILSQDGLCRPFDEMATGTVFSDGAGVLVLRRLEDAVNDGDTIYGILKGVGINNDGADKMSFTAPSVDGQLDVILRAHGDADIDPSTINYVEAHGTATPVGDPIEVEALKRAFGKNSATASCYLSSVKSNIGHLTAAAGVAGVIKSLLALRHGLIPGTANFHSPNKLIALEDSPFIVTNKTCPWPQVQTPRRAAVSSFGVGGTNAHVILEEYKPIPSTIPKPRYCLFKLSAKGEGQLKRMQENILNQLRNTDQSHWPYVAYTLETGRKEFEHRAYIVAKDKEDIESLRPSHSGKGHHQASHELFFLFPGQGSQYPQMGKELYQSSPIFAAYFDQCCKLIEKYVPYDIKEILFDSDKNELLNNTFYTQPCIFIMEYCLAKTMMDLGLRPKALMGHSIGEYAAATLAGVFSLEDGLRVIAKRAQVVAQLPEGLMLSVAASPEKVKEMIAHLPLDLAAENGPEACVLAGNSKDIEAFKELVSAKGIASLILKTSHAFHSRYMWPAVKELQSVLEEVNKNRPSIPICSTVTGRWEDELLTTSSYWAEHVVNCVAFSTAAKCFAPNGEGFYLEVGPKNVLTSLMRKQWAHLGIKKHKAQNILGSNIDEENKSFLRSIGELWLSGIKLNPPEALYALEERRRFPTVTYAFEERPMWLSNQIHTKDIQHITKKEDMNNNKQSLYEKLFNLFEHSSGIDVRSFGVNASFLEMGMDSLFLTQMALKLKTEFKVNISFRQLLEEFSTVEALAGLLVEHWNPPMPVKQNKVENTRAPLPLKSGVEDLLARQLEIMNQQLQVLQGNVNVISHTVPVETTPKNQESRSKEPFGASARIVVEKDRQFTFDQEKRLQDFFRKYSIKTKGSKEFTQDNRKIHADPRVVTGFRPEGKEIVYPIVVQRSQGQRLWDLDGNEYIDMICGFGSNFFGNGNERIKSAVIKQLHDGIELGPQHPLTADVARLINELTGNERTAFCNTGSEAVLGAMRIARTVTGREKIIVFSGSYHGINDEVIIRGNKNGPFPAAPGINETSVANMIVLDYGTEESLNIIRGMASEVAAVLVEPVQSRRCDFRPVEFLKEVREITSASNTCLIFDEVITGFRTRLGGAQEHFGIRADLCTYGKIVGGGQPIGVISGKSEFMDALDGGHWCFGDDSTPTAGVTYFAGTFVRHPLALAAAKAALEILKEGGNELLHDLSIRAQNFADQINGLCKQLNVPLEMNNFGPLLKPKWKKNLSGGEYLFALLRYHGVHVYDGFPWFVNLAHTQEELDTVVRAFQQSLTELQALGLLPDSMPARLPKVFDPTTAPVEGARLGRDEQGNPAWFVERSGEYFMVEG